MRDYFKKKVMLLTVRKKVEEAKKDLLPNTMLIPTFESIFEVILSM
jgi:hypothetical protein